jgi:peptidoglycan hydrolase-like protein with peptidoglycan-binding domain
MVFLDACRDNPLARTLARRMGPSRSGSIGAGLAEIKPQETGGEGSVIAFATSPGDVALDGDGSNSPFTSALIRNIDAPNASIQTVMTRVTGEVFLNKQDTPATTTVASLGDTATATPQQPAANPAVSTGNTQSAIAWEREKLIWETAKSSNTVADYEAYLQAYPAGLFADFARNSIKRLQAESQVASLNPSATTAASDAATSTSGAVASLPNPQNAVPGTEATEAALGWSRNSRVEVQTRLNLAGHDVGRPDGAFGPKTRSGVSAWQTANGIVPTGYFTAAQYSLLTTQTATQYSAYQAEVNRKRQAAAASRSTAPTRSNSNTQTTNNTRRTNNNGGGGGINPAGAAFIGGVVGGIIGGAIGR